MKHKSEAMLLKKADVAIELAISTRSVDSLIHAGHLERVWLGKQTLRFRREDVERLCNIGVLQVSETLVH